MKLGLVTYNMAKEWDLDTIIEKCEETGFQGVELRTTHAHGVESDLSKKEREEVKDKFESSDVELVGIGTAFEYHSLDEDELRKNIEGTKEYAVLARDIGAEEIKVRPNGLQVDKGVEKGKTLEQIGNSLRECGEYAQDYDIEIRLEVHGQGTKDPKNIQRIMEVADHDNVKVCWNSNDSDVIDGSVAANFHRVQDWITQIHMRDLFLDYPWKELFTLLRGIDFDGWCLAEIPGSSDPVRVMKYYRALWEELSSP